MENNNKKYVVLVHDRREGTYAYRGEGTRKESIEDVNVLVEEKKIPGRKIEIVPVKGESRTTTTTSSEDNMAEVVIISVITTATLLIGSYYGWKYWKKLKKKYLK